MLGGELNLVACPHCGHIAFQDRFLIYQDPAAELIAYVYPEAQQAQRAELEAMMIKGFNEAQASMPEKARVKYEPILFFGLESLIEQLQREDALAEQSQIAQVLCKENKLATEFLRPSAARKLHTMRVLPRTGSTKPASRTEILEGIQKLLQLNPALDLYAKLQENIQSDKEWSIS